MSALENPHTTTVAAGAQAAPSAPTGILRVVRIVLGKPLAVVAICWLLLVVIAAVGADWLAPYDPLENNFTLEGILQGPSAEHWLGTDENGRDVLSRLLYGARIALAVGFGSVLVAMLIGVPIGLFLGYRGGWSDRVGTRFVDIFDALPGMLVAFAIVAILGRGLPSIMLAIGLIFAMNFARMARAITLAERSKLYVDAAKVGGIRESSILFRQVLPNLAGPLVIQGAILVGAAIIIESALSFLGIGLESSVPSWGGLLGVAAAKQAVQPFLAFPPGLTIILTVLAFNVLGDAVSEALHGEKRKRFKILTPKTQAAAAPAAAAADPDAILEIRHLNVELRGAGEPVPLVRDVSLTLQRGEIVGLLGESGSGKSTTARAVLGLLPPGIGISSGSILLDGHELVGRTEKQLRRFRGTTVAAVFQDPMASLSPVHTVGEQLREPLRAHFKLSKKAARARAIELLDRVGVQNAAARIDDYPHQFSGGMAQRVAIAMALSAGPMLLIADEATSALDVTTQAQVLDLLLDLRDEFGMAILLITHDLGVVAEACDRAAVMYRGEVVEITEDAATLFDAPAHEYTAKLLSARTPRPRRKTVAPPVETVVP
ncbi:peptide/nickel transport system permease protein [Microbacterium sp. cf046]|uniref:dipeptide/oligopeptide/nickel ABC transporter permease/ATP-binding protein n=1 Tax=Microbacterium sp. cf046 TaxID=1761803 RepID=UPI0008DF3414|nr:dipeptide/oligopeptide/nickel ABC transporter permease/ATP-binding protein [Microbacterium sp. cf046]SFR89556.1 peptide/nickel transport system permease protein [Microbacterium sp. cf046]